MDAGTAVVHLDPDGRFSAKKIGFLQTSFLHLQGAPEAWDAAGLGEIALANRSSPGVTSGDRAANVKYFKGGSLAHEYTIANVGKIGWVSLPPGKGCVIVSGSTADSNHDFLCRIDLSSGKQKFVDLEARPELGRFQSAGKPVWDARKSQLIFVSQRRLITTGTPVLIRDVTEIARLNPDDLSISDRVPLGGALVSSIPLKYKVQSDCLLCYVEGTAGAKQVPAGLYDISASTGKATLVLQDTTAGRLNSRVGLPALIGNRYVILSKISVTHLPPFGEKEVGFVADLQAKTWTELSAIAQDPIHLAKDVKAGQWSLVVMAIVAPWGLGSIIQPVSQEHLQVPDLAPASSTTPLGNSN